MSRVRDDVARPPRRAVLLLPLVPAVSLLLAVFLPFVNSSRLWFGLPPLFVWASAGVLLITPSLAAVEHFWSRRRDLAEVGE